MLAAVAALVCSCQKVEDENKVSDSGGYSFNFTIAPGGFENTKGDATVGWTVGEKVYVFFQPDGGSLISDVYVAFTYKEGYHAHFVQKYSKTFPNYFAIIFINVSSSGWR